MKPAESAVVFDWDDVVFNTAAFKQSIADDIATQGISRDLVMDTVGVAKDAHGYDPVIHARMITKVAGGSATQVSRLIRTGSRHLADKLLFPDAVRTIHAIHGSGTPLYVLSAGRLHFQKERIFGSGLTRLFREIHIVDVTSPDAAVATKAKVLTRLAKKHKDLIFLDDRPKTIVGVGDIPELKDKVLPILVWRKQEKPPRGPIVIKSLSWREIRKIAIHKGFGPY